MRDGIKTLDLDKYEIGILINALNEFRNMLIEQQREPAPVDELLLKAIDAPEKKRTLVKSLRKDDRRK